MIVDISILSMPYAPSTHKASTILVDVKTGRERIQNLDEESWTLEQRLQALREERDGLNTSCMVREALLLPIRKLSVELLEEIFVQSIPREFLGHFGLNEDVNPWRSDEPHPHFVCAHLAGVCRRWKAIIDASSQVWSTISLNVFLPNDISVVDQWLRISKLCPLDLYINPDLWSDGDQQAVFKLLRREVPRIHLFVCQLHNWDMVDLFPVETCTEAPNMDVFGVICDEDDGDMLDMDDWDRIRTGPLYAPKQQSPILRHSEHALKSLTSTPLLTLRSLNVIVSTLPSISYIDCLAGCPNLGSLYWSDHSHMSNGTHRADTHWRIPLPSLKRLEFSTDNPEGVENFLRSLHMPMLEKVILHASVPYMPPAPVMGMLKSLFKKRQQCSRV